ncbi:MAG: histidinol-phosphate transaminase [Burkholderiaceae bacterium]|nr:histidinol-phosphate transaminase [Burkholderiaceae bacterium]
MSIARTLIRADVRALSAYHVPDASGLVKLDAMENPYLLPPELQRQLGERLGAAALNRYPVPSYAKLKAALRERMGIPAGFDVVLGNGSDELISILSVACAKPGAKVLAPVPGFVMYAMSAQFAGLEFIGVPLAADLSLDLDAMLAAVREHRPAITYLAYPNNPTGNLFDLDAMLAIIREVGDTGLVVVDEAYQPFAGASFMPRLPQHPNVAVMRTVSKLGLAGIRLGYLSASRDLLAEFDKVRPPYNVNVLTETTAEFVLEHAAVLDAQAEAICAQRAALLAALAALPGVQVYPSAANFVLLRIVRPGLTGAQVFDRLLQRKVLVKNVGKMHALLENCLRVTVSTPEENAAFLAALQPSLES